MRTIIKVAAIIVNKKDEILLIKEKYNSKPKWNLIKGTFDNPKETLEDCVVREVKEEVDLKSKSPVLKQIFQYGDRKNRRLLFVFLVNKFQGKAKVDSQKNQKSRGENIFDLKWFSKKEINKMRKDEFIASYVHLSLKKYKNDSQINIVRI